MKKLISFLLALCLLCLPLTCGAASVDEMEDVPESQWYHAAVAYCLERGYMNGTAPGAPPPPGA